MRIAFVGKGGSGKTTLCSLLAKYMARKNLPVLAIDADINQHLAISLGASFEQAKAIRPLGIEINKIKKHLKGNNPLIKSASLMQKTTPPGNGSNMIKFQEKNPIFDYFEQNISGVRFMGVGEFTEEDLGIKCYHSKVGAVELILNHLIDKEKEYVFVDMTAGADSFASGLFTKFDLTLLVVEPTIKSTSVYTQYKNYARNHNVNIKVTANKIENKSDIDFIKKAVGKDLIAIMGQSQYIRDLEKGIILPIEKLEQKNKENLDLIISEIDKCKKNWKKFYEDTVYFHIKNAKSWANAQAGEDLTLQVDPNFNFEKIINS